MEQLKAATRLLAVESWFDRMSPEEQDQYIDEHPNSKYADQPRKVKHEDVTDVEPKGEKPKRTMHDVDRRLEELSNKPNLTKEEREEVEQLEEELDRLTEVEDFDVEEHDSSDLDQRHEQVKHKLATVNQKMDKANARYRELTDQPSTPEIDAELDKLERHIDDLLVEQANLEEELSDFGDD